MALQKSPPYKGVGGALQRDGVVLSPNTLVTFCRDQEIIYPAERWMRRQPGKKPGRDISIRHCPMPTSFSKLNEWIRRSKWNILKQRSGQRSSGSGWTVTGKVRDANGDFIGSKIIFFSHTAEGKRNYHLFWTKGETLYSVHSETLKGVEDIQSLCVP